MKKYFIYIIQKVREALTRAWNDLKSKKKRGVFAIILSAVAFYFWGLSSALLWLLFLLFLFYAWENRIIAAAALLCLVSCPILLHFKKDVWAETMAVYAYFFLVMTVVLQLVEYKKKGSGEEGVDRTVRE